jgi:hypothetical protein
LKLNLEHWEKDALEEKLDRLGFAYIDLHEYAEFCDEYDIDLGIQIEETHYEEIID